MNHWEIVVPLLTSALLIMRCDFGLVSKIVKTCKQRTDVARKAIGLEADKRFSWVGLEEIFLRFITAIGLENGEIPPRI